MKRENAIWGLVLIVTGAVFLLQNFGLVHLDWDQIWRFWPLVLILLGFNFLFSRYRGGFLISLVLTILFLAFLLYEGLVITRHQTVKPFNRNSAWSGQKQQESIYTEDYETNVKYANLTINGGVSNCLIESEPDKLFKAISATGYYKYFLRSLYSDSSVSLSLQLKDKADHPLSVKGNKLDVRLNTHPLWTINTNAPSSTFIFDMSTLRIGSLSFSEKVSFAKIKLGTSRETTTVKLDDGFEKLAFTVPRATQIKVLSEEDLPSLKGFSKQADGSFITSGYKESDAGIQIVLKGKGSDLSIDYY